MRRKQVVRSLEKGWSYLEKNQNADGSWLPLWFGNQDEADESNPIYGTARVLIAYAECDRLEHNAAKKAIDYLIARQNEDGGWGGGKSVAYVNPPQLDSRMTSTIEETSQALEALAACGLGQSAHSLRGFKWLKDAIHHGRHLQAQPIGFYFAKLWYYENMYPLVYSLAAFGRLRETS